MCRLYARISKEPDSPEFDLIRTPFSLLTQGSADPKSHQTDGWGIASLIGGQWRTLKSKGACFREAVKFRKASENISSRIVLAHIRRASNPRGMPRNRIIGLANCQPFTHKNLSFVHNGTLNIPDDVAATLGPYRRLIKGNNDSEVLFALFVKHYKKRVMSEFASRPPEHLPGTHSGSPPRIRPVEPPLRNGGYEPNSDITQNGWSRVFPAMLREINQVWRRIPPARRRHTAPFQGLNIIASDGKTLAAHCLYENMDAMNQCGEYSVLEGRLSPQAGGEPRRGFRQMSRWMTCIDSSHRSLCGQGRPYFEMCYNYSPHGLTVASEPLDRKRPWRRLKNGQILIASIEQGEPSNGGRIFIRHCLKS